MKNKLRLVLRLIDIKDKLEEKGLTELTEELKELIEDVEKCF